MDMSSVEAADLERRMAANVDSWLKHKQQQRSPNKTPRRDAAATASAPQGPVSPASAVKSRTSQSVPEAARDLAPIVLGSPPLTAPLETTPKAMPVAVGAPQKSPATAPLRLGAARGVMEYSDESDIFSDVTVTLRGPGIKSPRTWKLKIGETVQNIKRRLVSEPGAPYGYHEIELLLDGRPMMDPLSLNDFPSIETNKRADIEVAVVNSVRNSPQSQRGADIVDSKDAAIPISEQDAAADDGAVEVLLEEEEEREGDSEADGDDGVDGEVGGSEAEESGHKRQATDDADVEGKREDEEKEAAGSKDELDGSFAGLIKRIGDMHEREIAGTRRENERLKRELAEALKRASDMEERAERAERALSELGDRLDSTLGDLKIRKR